ncbi:hypothetical protein FQR65_LT05419 [Abscondita terminalis]|nr:hypothetical protein FQR65_LT05419 [Abscondita terminalis]
MRVLKQFTNWKHSTWQKARSLKAAKKTRVETSQEKSLTTLEERGLAVCGQVAVTGIPKVSAVNVLRLQVDLIDLSETEKSIEVIHTSDTEIVDSPKTIITTSATLQRISKNRKRKLQINNQKIKSIDAELLEIYKTNTKRKEENVDLEKKKILEEKIRLQFEIVKYKFEIPSFEFDDTELCDIK